MQLGVFDQLLTPVLVQATDVVLGALKEGELMQETFLDENAASVLGDDRLFVLIGDVSMCNVSLRAMPEDRP